MKDPIEDNGYFQLRSEDLADPAVKTEIPSEINELRLEKISQRVTLISILIPVLIVIVLVITYLDIKKRVVRTEDTGMIEFQKLSADLESRFSSLSVRQARLEDDMARTIEQNNHAAASVQVQLQKLQDALSKAQQNAVDKKEFKTTRDELVKQMNGLVDASNQASEQMAAIAREVKKQMDQLVVDVASAKQEIADMNRKASEIERKMIDKPAMDLALRLETLKVASDFKASIEMLQKKIATLEERLNRSNRATTSSPAPSAAPSSPAPTRQSTPQAPVSNPAQTAPSQEKIEEQTISR